MNDIIFRRVKGRIIPIKLTKEQKGRIVEGSKGIAIAGAGVGLSVASGQIYRKAVVSSANMAMKAFSTIENIADKFKNSGAAQQSLFDYVKRSEQISKQTSRLRTASRISGASKFLKAASLPIGAALISYGAYRTLNAIPKKEKNKINPAFVAGGGAAAAVIAPKAYNLAHDAFTAGIGGRQGVMNFGSSKVKSVLSILRKVVL